MSAKVLAIGLDSADKDLLLRWSDSGDLPNIQSLRQRGLWAMITSPEGLGDEATWATFYTGVSPSRHGRFFSRQVWPGSYDPIWFQDFHLKHEPFWERLSREGQRIGIFDVPKCTLSQDLNGVQLVDWLVHGNERSQPCSCPSSLATEVISRFGARPRSLCNYSMLLPSQYADFLNRLLGSIEMKTALLSSFLEKDNWDLFLTVFKESHCVGHHCWHFLDSSHPDHDPEFAQKLGDPIKQVYMALDGAIGRLLDQVGSDATVMVFSDLSMGPNYTGNPLLSEILNRLEGFPNQSAKTSIGRLRSMWRKLPLGVRRPVFRKLGRLNHAVKNFEQSLPTCFAVPHNELSGAIRINLVGREPNGRIHLGQEYDTFCEKLAQELMLLVCPDTGEPLVSKVLCMRDLYDGPFLDNLPDLLVIWNRNRPIAKAWSPKIGEVKVNYPPIRSGNHLPDGILFACGPGILPDHATGPVSLLDLPATIAVRLGVRMPYLDGSPIPEMCE